MKIKKIVFLALFSFFLFQQENFAQCEAGLSSAELNIGDVNALVNINGDLWWDGSNATYEVPKGGGVNALFTGSIWMGGMDVAGNLKLAAPTYGHTNQPEYYPGPIGSFDATPSQADCANWDRHFVVTRTEINALQADWTDNNMIDNAVPASLLQWPARGNPYFFDELGFDLPAFTAAPFFDFDNDGNYDPYSGDYPEVNGDQCIGWFFNDAGNLHFDTQGDIIRMDAFVMAYSYDTGVDVIDQSTFYDYTFVYHGFENIEQFYFGLWVDPDLGCYEDDFIGCIPSEDIGYVYNADAFDEDCVGINGYGENIPILGFKFLETPDDIGLSTFNYMLSQSLPGMDSPSSAPEYYNYLQGLWRDGTPLSQGGTGYDPTATEPYSYAFDQSLIGSFPWTECTANTVVGDRRILMGFGPFTLNPGDIKKLKFAVIFEQDVVYPCPETDILVSDADFVEAFDNFNGIADAAPIPLFEYAHQINPEVTNFTDFSLNNPTSWSWDFGDGNTSTEQNPQHTFASNVPQTVCLTATNDSGSNTICRTIFIGGSAAANFDFTQNEFEFNFSDASNFNPTSWSWDFGDGNTSTEQNPQHTYDGNGQYLVCLTATDDNGISDTYCQSIDIDILLPPIAAFNVGGSAAALNRFFINQSLNPPFTSFWDFGDGNTSTVSTTTHVYAMAGEYEVCLTVTNEAGEDTYCEIITVGLTSTEQLDDNQYWIAPNPIQESGFLYVEHFDLSNIQFQVIDFAGQKISTPYKTASTHLEFDVDHLSPGIYLFELWNKKDALIRGKFVVHHK